MTLLVTGGAGFIGSNFIFYWLKHHPEDRVVCLDKLTYAGNLATLVPVMDHPNFRFVRGDICDRAAVKRLFEEEQPQAVINFAAESHVDRSIQAPEVFLQTNVLGTQVLLDACCAHGGVRFHQVSTDEVYGDLPLDRPDLLFTEESPLRPSSPYSASKAGSDLLTLAYCRTYGLPVTVSRCSNNYGPYQFPEKLIPRMIVRALAGKTLPVYGRERTCGTGSTWTTTAPPWMQSSKAVRLERSTTSEATANAPTWRSCALSATGWRYPRSR